MFILWHQLIHIVVNYSCMTPRMWNRHFRRLTGLEINIGHMLLLEIYVIHLEWTILTDPHSVKRQRATSHGPTQGSWLGGLGKWLQEELCRGDDDLEDKNCWTHWTVRLLVPSPQCVEHSDWLITCHLRKKFASLIIGI